jgi:hypothetical protein
MDDGIDMLDGQVGSFQETAESPIDILHPPRQFRDSFGVCLNLHPESGVKTMPKKSKQQDF